MMTSYARKDIPWISTLWDIKRKMYIVALPEMVWEWTILWESTVCDIENIRSTKQIVRIQALFVICPIWYEITVLGCSIAIDILAILTELVAILQTYLRSSRQELIPTLPYRSLCVESETVCIGISSITPPLVLRIDRSSVFWWIYADDRLSTKARYSLMEREKIFETQSSPESLFWA
jgi:hypothetical protein